MEVAISKWSMIGAALTSWLPVWPAEAAAHPVSYGLTARDGSSLDSKALATLASRLIELSGKVRSRTPGQRATLLLATRQNVAARVAFQSLECHPAADPASSRSCLIGAWEQSHASGSALIDRLDDMVSRLDPIPRERILARFRVRERDNRAELDRLLSQNAGAEKIDTSDAMQIIETALVADAYRAAGLSIDTIVARERARLYRIDTTLLIPTPDGANLSATLVRPRASAGPLSTAMLFTIYSDPERNLKIAALGSGAAGTRKDESTVAQMRSALAILQRFHV